MPDPFYSTSAWQSLRHRVRTRWLAQGRPCAYCHKPIVQGQSSIVDHIIPRSKRPDLQLVESNLRLVHWSCHNQLTHTQKDPVSYDGYPPDWQ